jgi:histidinol-phosphate phosphatase family protein
MKPEEKLNLDFKNVRLLILAGGKGTRLASVVSDRPKPMALIGDIPFLEIQLQFFKDQGIRKVTLLVCHMKDVIKDHFGDGANWDLEIDYIIEDEPLGTGGAIFNAMSKLQDDWFLVTNGDTLFTMDLNYWTSHLQKNWTGGLVAMSVSHDVSRFGRVQWNSKNFQIEKFEEKSKLENQDGYINAGTYLLHRSVLTNWAIDKNVFSFETDVMPAQVGTKSLLAMPCGGKFVDIGTPESYDWAQTRLTNWLAEKRRPCLFLDRDGTMIKHVAYLSKVDQVEIFPEMIELVKHANKNNWHVVVVTNQAGIGRGYFTEKECNEVHSHIDEEFRKHGAKIDKWCLCPFHPNEGVGKFKRESVFRKPNPGMLLDAAMELNIDFSKCVMVGDNKFDNIVMPGLRVHLIQGDHDLTGVDGVGIFQSPREVVDHLIDRHIK